MSHDIHVILPYRVHNKKSMHMWIHSLGKVWSAY